MLHQDYNKQLLTLCNLLHSQAVLTESALKYLNELLNKLLFKLFDNQHDLDNFMLMLLSPDMNAVMAWTIDKTMVQHDKSVFIDSVGWMKLTDSSKQLVCAFVEFLFGDIFDKAIEVAEKTFYDELETQQLDDDAYDAYLDTHPLVIEITDTTVQSAIHDDLLQSIVNAL
jgi:hypothetical protein